MKCPSCKETIDHVDCEMVGQVNLADEPENLLDEQLEGEWDLQASGFSTIYSCPRCHAELTVIASPRFKNRFEITNKTQEST